MLYCLCLISVVIDSMQCKLSDEFKNTRNGDMEPQSSTYEVYMNPTSPAVKMPCKEACAFVLEKKKKKKKMSTCA
uniref:Secreted protein n=1 Tax=Populus trichocarpa TaxID=3694 RepID=A0A2K1YCM6_POPTR